MPISNIGLQEIHLDISTKLRQKTFYANEVDTNGRGLHAFLQDNGVKVNGTGVTVQFRYKSLNDGESQVYDFVPIGDPTNGEFELYYPTEMVRGHGNKLFPCTIVARDSTSELAFENVFVYVNKAEVNTEGVEASNEYSALKQSLDKVDTWDATFETKYTGLETEYATDLTVVKSQLAETSSQVDVTKLPIQYVSAKGDGTSDDTQSFISAISYALLKGCRKIFVPTGTYMVDGVGEVSEDLNVRYSRINIPSNFEFVMSSNATLKQIPTLSGAYSILGTRDSENVLISGGNIIGDRDVHLGVDGEWGYGLQIDSCKNIIVDNVKISRCWGDGINLSNNANNTNKPDNENITLQNCVCDFNRRQGLSLQSGIDILINKCIFSNTVGTNPQSGIDIEHNNGLETTKQITIKNCIFKNNTINLVNYSGIDVLIDGNSFFIEGSDGQITSGNVSDKLKITNNIFYGGTVAIKNNNTIFESNNCSNTILWIDSPVNVLHDIFISKNMFYGKGIQDYIGAFRVKTTNFKIDNNMFSDVSTSILIQNMDNIEISNNKISNDLGTGMLIGSNYAQLTGNTFDTINESAILIKNGFIGCVIKHNIIIDPCKNPVLPTGHCAINLNGTDCIIDGNVITILTSDVANISLIISISEIALKCVCTNNKIRSVNKPYIGIGVIGDYCIVSGNDVRDCATIGVYLEPGTTTHNIANINNYA